MAEANFPLHSQHQYTPEESSTQQMMTPKDRRRHRKKLAMRRLRQRARRKQEPYRPPSQRVLAAGEDSDTDDNHEPPPAFNKEMPAWLVAARARMPKPASSDESSDSDATPRIVAASSKHPREDPREGTSGAGDLGEDHQESVQGRRHEKTAEQT